MFGLGAHDKSTYQPMTFSKTSGWRFNAQPVEQLSTLGWVVTSDPAYFGLLSFISISHHINLLLINLGI